MIFVSLGEILNMESVVYEGHTLNEEHIIGREHDLYQDQSGDIGCARCGKCCVLSSKKILSVSDSDIRKIERMTGLTEEQFSWYHPHYDYKTLRSKYDPISRESHCLFFDRDDKNIGYCSIHDELNNGKKIMPVLCRYYPYGNRCENGRIIQTNLVDRIISKIRHFI
jgi:Fe-S-cluster containining protein